MSKDGKIKNIFDRIKFKRKSSSLSKQLFTVWKFVKDKFILVKLPLVIGKSYYKKDISIGNPVDSTLLSLVLADLFNLTIDKFAKEDNNLIAKAYLVHGIATNISDISYLSKNTSNKQSIVTSPVVIISWKKAKDSPFKNSRTIKNDVFKIDNKLNGIAIFWDCSKNKPGDIDNLIMSGENKTSFFEKNNSGYELLFNDKEELKWTDEKTGKDNSNETSIIKSNKPGINCTQFGKAKIRSHNERTEDDTTLDKYFDFIKDRLLKSRFGMSAEDDVKLNLTNPDGIISWAGLYTGNVEVIPGMVEQSYKTVISHELTHYWQSKSGKWDAKLHYFNSDDPNDENNILFDGKLLIEGFAEWISLNLYVSFSFDKHINDIIRGYKIFPDIPNEYYCGLYMFAYMIAEMNVSYTKLFKFLNDPSDIKILFSDENIIKEIKGFFGDGATPAQQLCYIYSKTIHNDIWQYINETNTDESWLYKEGFIVNLNNYKKYHSWLVKSTYFISYQEDIITYTPSNITEDLFPFLSIRLLKKVLGKKWETFEEELYNSENNAKIYCRGRGDLSLDIICFINATDSLPKSTLLKNAWANFNKLLDR